LAAAAELRRTHPQIGVLVLSTYAEVTYALALLAVDQSRVGYLLKDRVDDVHHLRDALERVARGETVIDPDIVRQLIARRRTRDPLQALTERERQVLALLAEGRSNAGIAAALHLRAKTVETHVAHIFTQLGLATDPHDNRRVLAALTWLRGRGNPS
jgi:DNA-binding NarL/FixJ family response regulator